MPDELMPIQPGTTRGPYSVTAKIGEGGMGEVWQARDTKLDRDVALKVLPEAFTSDPDRLARFEREAKVLASLNHPNIGSIYGLEEAEGVKALVLELAEGPTLADRIKQGPIPLDEALPIAKQIAEALEAGHEAGVIRRDLKPANIKVREDGTAKVLDFGLAKALYRQSLCGSARLPAGDLRARHPERHRHGVSSPDGRAVGDGKRPSGRGRDQHHTGRSGAAALVGFEPASGVAVPPFSTAVAVQNSRLDRLPCGPGHPRLRPPSRTAPRWPCRRRARRRRRRPC